MDRRVVSSIILGLAAFGVVFQAISFLTPGWVCIESGDDVAERANKMSQRLQPSSSPLNAHAGQEQNGGHNADDEDNVADEYTVTQSVPQPGTTKKNEKRKGNGDSSDDGSSRKVRRKCKPRNNAGQTRPPGGRPGKPGKADKPDKPVRPNRPNRPNRPGRPGGSGKPSGDKPILIPDANSDKPGKSSGKSDRVNCDDDDDADNTDEGTEEDPDNGATRSNNGDKPKGKRQGSSQDGRQNKNDTKEGTDEKDPAKGGKGKKGKKLKGKGADPRSKKTQQSISSALGGRKLFTFWSIKIGLLYTWKCQQVVGAEDTACDYGDEKSLLLLKVASKQEIDVSTWRGLRVSAGLGMAAGVVGLVAMVLTLKTSCFRSRTRILIIVAFVGMILSGFLIMVPVAMLGNVNSVVKDHLEAFSKTAILSTAWSIVIGGIGACATIVASVALVMFSWNDIKDTKFKGFDDEFSIGKRPSFHKEIEEESNYADIKDTYDNPSVTEDSKA